jgi:uncharacterized protein (UPF0335 family)
MKTIEDVKKWLQLVNKPEVYVYYEKDKSPVFDFTSSENVCYTLDFLDNVYDTLSNGNYLVKARNKGGSNNSFVVNTFAKTELRPSFQNVSMQSATMNTSSKDVQKLIEEALANQRLQFEKERLEDKVNALLSKIERLEEKFAMLVDEVEDLADDKSKAGTGNIIKDLVKDKGGDLVANTIKNFSNFKK